MPCLSRSHLLINLQHTLKNTIDPQKSLVFIHRPQNAYTPRPNIPRRATPVIPAVSIRTQLSAQVLADLNAV